MPTPGALSGDVLRSLKDHLRPLIAYHAFFTLLATGLLLPATGWGLAHLLARLDRPLISLAALLDILLTPTGLAWLMSTLGVGFLIIYLQQAGMTLVTVRPRDNHLHLAAEALWGSLRRLPALAGLVILQVGAQLLLLLPVVAALTGLHDRLLGDLDPYYVRQVRPPALWHYLATILPLVLGWALAAAFLYTRWHLALPSLILEDLGPRRALARSVQLTRGRRPGIAATIVVLLALIVAMPLLATTLFDALFTPLLGHLPLHRAVLLPAMLGYVVAYMLLTLAITFVGIAANALLGTCLYLRLAHREPRPPTPPPNAHPGRLAWAVEVAVLAFAIGQAWWVIDRDSLQERVTVIAHRGSSQLAPENTLPAIDRAIADGADLIEIDARLTADASVVLYHDSTLSRLVGDPRRIAALDRDTLDTVDVGSWFGDPFVGTRLPGLDEALARIRGRAGLMIELKPDAGRHAMLLRRVLAALDAEARERRRCRGKAPDGIARAACGDPALWSQVILATQVYSLLDEIARQAPEARRVLLAELAMRGSLPRGDFEVLALHHSRIDAAERRRARDEGYRLYAWTVNDPARMSQLIDLGIDGIITDRPERLNALLAERQRLGDGALMLVKLHSWLRD
ncbi:glycerophosphodiester phosphodiesterase family protein [Halomonas organivorans]|uniref:Glycerophosphoryl diester phosphodiesterase n=1 Tax=Halomonas organivorans TaxID=257772 RepID=A0A7W5BWY9_9GAMM|nr:glycerophosphodiester phosphodiesterase family protein [Halomonas organivorans]MBB3140665.1 glycerophosphoryl diester phosphodiesterase [Halomonas organivorans]